MDEININEELYQYYAVSSDGTSLVNVNDLLNIQDDNNRTVQKVFYMALNDLTEEQQEHEQQQLQQQQQQQQLQQQQQQQEININEMLPQESSFNNLLVSNDLKLVSLNDGKIFMTSTSKDETLDTIQSQFILNGPDYNIIDNDASDDNNLVSLTSTIESVIPNYDESNIKYQLIELADGTKAIVKLYELKNNTTVTSGETIENCVLDQAKEDEIEEDNNNNNNNNNNDDDDDDDDEEEEDETFVQPRKPIKKFHCSYEGCDKVYCSSYHLNVHMRRHTDNKPFPCHMDGCDKKFSTNYSLKAHIRTHTGEKPYGCILCDKHFKTSGDLQKHIRIHTGEKPFVCPVEGCNKSFTTSNIRKVHIRSHTGERPYVCSYPNCGKAFTSSTNYKNHIRIHSGEKPYLCSVEGCGRRFTEYSSLYKHNAVHQPSRPHNCNLCEQKFKQEQALNMHKRVVHNVVACTMDGTDIIVKIN